MLGTGDGLFFDYEGQNGDPQQQFSQTHAGPQPQHPRMPSWPLPSSTQHRHTQDANASSTSPQMSVNAYKRSSSPLPMSMARQQSYQEPAGPAAPNQLMGGWVMGHSQIPTVSLALDTAATFPASNFNSYGGMSFQTSPQDFMTPQQPETFLNQNLVDQSLNSAGINVNNLGLNTNISMDNASFINLNMANLQEIQLPFENPLLFPGGLHDPTAQLQALNPQQPQHQTFSAPSPSDYPSDIEVRSLSSSENGSPTGWSLVDHPGQTIFNPQQALHHRSPSDSSSDLEQAPRNSFEIDGFMDMGIKQLNSPSSESGPGSVYSDGSSFSHLQKPSPPPTMTTSDTVAIPIRRPGSQRKPPTSPTSCSTGAGVSKRGPKPARRPATVNGKDEKRIGRRKGPLNAQQRKQASEIRKLRACIRCRFLKKTCDKGDPCAGCKPSHARLWLVPCTRVDIKDLGYFVKGWKADYERHVTLALTPHNIKGYGDLEKPLLVTHGYGHYLPIKAREVYVRDESCFGVNWVEAHSGEHEEFSVDTARLSAGADGVNAGMLSDYLDMHIDGGFERFVDEHFQGTPFITEMLKIAYRFYTKEKTQVIRKALKLVLAYNLTQAILLVKGFGAEEDMDGKISDNRSEFNGEVAAPMMINFQVKSAMADVWRDLQKSLLEDLSALYSGIYNGDKLKHWPTIFMLAAVLLVVWEEMQFDCRYRIPDEKVVEKFCHDMESTPVGVIVGLFSAISQKVPSFIEWDTSKHQTSIGFNDAVCEAMEEVREGIRRHEKYLRGRKTAKFDRGDFDSLSNTFVSKLVIRAH